MCKWEGVLFEKYLNYLIALIAGLIVFNMGVQIGIFVGKRLVSQIGGAHE